MGRAKPDDLLFPRWDGQPRSPHWLTQKFGQAMRTLKIEGVTVHSLRHTHASQLIAGGMDVLTISRRLRHGSPTITLATYGHMFRNTDSQSSRNPRGDVRQITAMTKLSAMLALKTAIVGAVLTGLVMAGYYGLSLVAEGRREGLATLVGAAATIFAGWLAWQSVIFQARRTEADQIERAEARKEDLVVAVAQPVHAASTLAACIVKELSQTGDSVASRSGSRDAPIS